MVAVKENELNGELFLIDNLYQKDKDVYRDVYDLLKPVFKDGKLLREISLSDIRSRLKLELRTSKVQKVNI